MHRGRFQNGVTAAGCAFALGVVGCVIPVAPEFEEEENLPPYIVDSAPPEGGLLDLTSPTPLREFQVTVADPNLNDYLYVRWLIDYPSFTPNSRQTGDETLPPTGRPERARVTLFPSCFLIARGFENHKVVLAVADRPFVDPESDSVPPGGELDTVKGGNRVRAVWLLKVDCGQ